MIRVFEPRLNIRDIYSVTKTLIKNDISGTSQVVKEFEKKLGNKFDRKYATAVSNGSVALDIAFQALDLSEDDEVILPAFTIISCLSAVIRSKAKPVFCDVDPNTWNMTLKDVKNCYTSKTKAVLMVHTYGLTADAINISEFCKKNNLILIEDSAEAHGQKLNSKKCGSFGLISTFSFYSNKHITTGEGGAVMTNSKDIHNKIQQMRNLDFTVKERFNHENLYWNYRIGGMQAALGISQIDSLEKVIKEKIKQGKYYLQLLENHQDKFTLPLGRYEKCENHFWVFGVVLKQEGIRDQVIELMSKRDIETRPFFWPLHLQKYLKNKRGFQKISLPISEKIGQNGLYIPIGSHINKSKQEEIIKNLVDIIENYQLTK